ncbi:MAG: hypothetical protein ACI822_001815 [Gammaproteobacteria bacterium]|jgi:hypothetical protein
MEASDRPAKTVKGKSEIASKSGELSLFDRRVLILVNGENSISLIQDLSQMENVIDILQTLHRKGYIEGLVDSDKMQTLASSTSAGIRNPPVAGEFSSIFGYPRSVGTGAKPDLKLLTSCLPRNLPVNSGLALEN